MFQGSTCDGDPRQQRREPQEHGWWPSGFRRGSNVRADDKWPGGHGQSLHVCESNVSWGPALERRWARGFPKAFKASNAVFFNLIFLLEYRCFTILCWFLLYNMNQWDVCICPLPWTSLPPPISPLQVITEPGAELPVWYSSFPLASYFTHSNILLYIAFTLGGWRSLLRVLARRANLSMLQEINCAY